MSFSNTFTQPIIKAEYQERKGGKVVCTLCPHFCELENGHAGVCGGRAVIDGNLIATNYGQIASLYLDPIEKKPLYHFYPGSEILSVGPNGCNLKCKWCQNHVANEAVSPSRLIMPEVLADMVDALDGIGIAYTYGEPLVWFEYARDVGRILHERGLVNVFVSNGYINEPPLRELLPFTDAFNIDLKSNEDYCYRHFCGGKLEDVERTIKIVVDEGKHLELTHLMVTGLATDLSKLEKLVKWIANLSPAIPLHLNRYFPANTYTEPPTDMALMRRGYDVAREHLDFVYMGNVWTEEHQDSVCPSCGHTLVERHAGEVKIVGLDKNLCRGCGKELNFIAS